MNLFLLLLRRIFANSDAILDMIAGWIPGLELAAQRTDTLLDDMALRSAEVTLADPEFREQFRAWHSGIFAQASLLMSLSSDDLSMRLRTDAATMSIVQQVAGRFNIDWQKLLDLIVKYLPLILPLVLAPKDEA